MDTSAVGILVTESIIRPVVSFTTTGSTPLLLDCQSQRVSSIQMSVLLPLDRHLCCRTISHREYHPSCCQCYYHCIDTSAGGLLFTESINRPVVSVSITGSTPLLVDYQSQRVSTVLLSVLLSLDLHLCWWIISHREYDPSSSQCFYSWIDTSAGGILVTESIIPPVVSVSIPGSTPLLVDYQSQRVSFVLLSVLLPLDRHLCCWTVSHRECHPSSCQFYYHWIDTSAVGLLVEESVIHPVDSVTTTGSTPLLVDYQSQQVSFIQQSVFLSLDRHLCWWTISHREHHPSSCQFYYHWIDTSAGGLLVTESIIRPVVRVTTTGSTPLLVDYQSQRVSSSSSQCFYHWIDTSAGGLLVTTSIIRPVVSVSITGSTPLLVDYQSQRVSSVLLSVFLSMDRHLCWWTISHREYHPFSSQCFYHWIDISDGGLLVTESIIRPVVNVTSAGSTPLLVDYQSQRVSFVQQSVLLSLNRHLCCWTISHREYHPSCCQCYYHWIDTSAGGLLVTESIIRPVVSVTTAGSTPLLVDYQSQRVSFVQFSMLLPLDRHLCQRTISHREYHPSSCQCYYCWFDTSAGGLLVTESIIRPVVSVTITGSTHLLVDYQSQRVSPVLLSMLLSLDRHLSCWTNSHREYHPSCCQCY